LNVKERAKNIGLYTMADVDVGLRL